MATTEQLSRGKAIPRPIAAGHLKRRKQQKHMPARRGCKPCCQARKRVIGGVARRGSGRHLHRRVPCHGGVPCRGSLYALAASQRVAVAPGRAQEDTREPYARASALALGLCSWWYAGSLAVQNAWLYVGADFLHFAWPGRGQRLAWACAWHLTFLDVPPLPFCALYHMYTRAVAH